MILPRQRLVEREVVRWRSSGLDSGDTHECMRAMIFPFEHLSFYTIEGHRMIMSFILLNRLQEPVSKVPAA